MQHRASRWCPSSIAVIVVSVSLLSPDLALTADSGTLSHGQVADSIRNNAQVLDETSWEVSVGALYSDNITRSETDKHGDVSPNARVSGILSSNRERLTTQIAADMSYTEYPSGFSEAASASPEKLLGAASVSLVGSIIPDRFLWNLKDSYGIAPVNLAKQDTAFNRQRTNVFETGPRILIPIGARNELQVSASWFSSSFDVSNVNGTGEQASAAIVHQLSRDSNVSVQVSGTRIAYPESQADRDFDIRSAFLGWNRVHGRGEWQVQLGTTEIRSAGSTPQHSPLVRVTFKRLLSKKSSLSMSAGREFSSSAQAFQGNQAFFGVSRSLNDVQVTADPYRTDFALLSWQVDNRRLTVNTQLNIRRDTYESNPLLNAKLYGIQALLGRDISSRLRFSVSAEYLRKQFDGRNITTDDRRIGAGLGFTLTPALVLTVGVGRNSGRSEQSLRSSSENTAQARLTYRPVAR